MKSTFSLLLCCILAAPACLAQTDLSRFITDTTIGDIRVHMLRVPIDKVPERIQRDVQETQQCLDENFEKYRHGEHLFDFAFMMAREIKAFLPSWPAEYYEEEEKAYRTYMKVRSEHIRDSAYAANRREVDRKEAVADSLRVVSATRGW